MDQIKFWTNRAWTTTSPDVDHWGKQRITINEPIPLFVNRAVTHRRRCNIEIARL